jgi:hypothetical protein
MMDREGTAVAPTSGLQLMEDAKVKNAPPIKL